MIPLLPVTQDFGGLRIVPKSHTDKMQEWMCERFPTVDYMGDYLELNKNDQIVAHDMGKLVECDPGDMIIWDSRTIHGGLVGTPS